MTTNVPPIQFTDTGVILPSTADVLTGRLEDIDQAFGGGLNTTNMFTPQAQIASAETFTISAGQEAIANVQNMTDPMYSSGVWQDAIGRLFRISRLGAVATTVEVLCQGAVGTVIPALSTVSDGSGNTYALTNSVTIGSDGSVTGVFANQITGPIGCPAGTVTTINTVIAGWERVSNPSSGVIGRDQETRNEFETSRQQMLAMNATQTYEAVRGAVKAVSGVTDCYVYDNYTGRDIQQGSTNYTIKKNSIYVAVAGSFNNADVANAILSKKAPGSDYNGNTTVTVSDTGSAVSPPPTYPVSFEIPNNVDIYFTVNIKNVNNLPTNYVALIQQAVVNQFTGLGNGPGETIADTVFASDYYTLIQQQSSTFEIVTLFVGFAANPAILTLLPVGIDQKPVVSTANVAVNVV